MALYGVELTHMSSSGWRVLFVEALSEMSARIKAMRADYYVSYVEKL